MSVVSSSRRRLMIEAAPATGLEALTRRAASEVNRLEAISTSATGTEAGSPTGGFAPPAGGRGPALHPWDEAHCPLDAPGLAGMDSAPRYVEPDVVQRVPYSGPDDISLESFAGSGVCQYIGPDSFWPAATLQFGRHLDDDHSQLSAPHLRAGDPGEGRRVRIAILDTGYDPEHATLPAHLRTDLQRNFFDEDRLDATDPDRLTYFGQGHLRANAALDIPFKIGLEKTPRDEASFARLRLPGVLEAAPAPPAATRPLPPALR